jgi:hypothetical protein
MYSLSGSPVKKLAKMIGTVSGSVGDVRDCQLATKVIFDVV